MAEHENEPSYAFKIIVLGDKDVGKSSLLKRFQYDEFDPVPSHTIGVNFWPHKIVVGTKNVQLTLWDTAGEERYKSLATQYYRNADAAVIVFDLTSKKSFNSVGEWINRFYKIVGSKSVIIVGNKNDLIEKREVDKDDFKELTSLYCAHPWEASAKEATNVDTIFQELTKELISQTDQLQSLQSSGPDSFSLHTVSDTSQQSMYARCCGY